MHTMISQSLTQSDFVAALGDEILILTGYGIHAHLSPLAISDCYSKYQQSQLPLRAYAESVLKHYNH